MESEMRDESTMRTSESGFSLVELMMAVVITLVITGAVYGLMASGQNAFRREPELAERQQNIRMAMDVIMKDVANAGSGLPTFVQTFTPGLDACAACPLGPDGVKTDEIEILTNSESRDTEPLCRTIGVPNSANLRLIRNTAIPVNTVVIPFTATGLWTLRNVTSTTTNGAAAFDCTAGTHTQVGMLTAAPGDPTGLNTPATACEPNTWGNTTSPCELVGLSFANVVHYRIRMDTSVPPVPMLERWSSDAPGAIVGRAPVGYQTLARGIENMQVQYLRADGTPGNPPTVPGTWVDSAPAVASPNYATLITQVRITLAARSEARNVAGGTTSISGGAAIRGTLMSSASPRATLMNLTLQPQPLPPASPIPLLWR
jgi:prepilin-type N-terminal cleavage/methylation domain-containing protein